MNNNTSRDERPPFDALTSNAHAVTRKLFQTLKPVERSAVGGTFVFAKLPRVVQAKLLEPMLNHALSALIAAGELDFLMERCCEIAIIDKAESWVIYLDGNRLSLSDESQADVTISATVPAFLSLISQQDDPDTLFFQRQLAITGDVELGLHIKNLLDALDEDELPFVWRQALSSLRFLVDLESHDLD